MTQRNLTAEEKDYENLRSKLINSVTKEYISEAPMCFSNRVGVQSLITRYELYKLILNIPGDIIECGVYKGNSFAFLAHLSVILEPFSINRRLIGFDTFEGFSSIDKKKDPSNISQKNFSDTSIDITSKCLGAIDIVRPVNKIPRFNLIKGDILTTIPKFVKENPWMSCAMLILDTDLYAPTKIALEYVLPLMPKGAVIVFDEYNYQNFPGETQAINEFFKLNTLRVRKMSYESCSAYTIIE
jgi:hypothetical protein